MDVVFASVQAVDSDVIWLRLLSEPYLKLLPLGWCHHLPLPANGLINVMGPCRGPSDLPSADIF